MDVPLHWPVDSSVCPCGAPILPPTMEVFFFVGTLFEASRKPPILGVPYPILRQTHVEVPFLDQMGGGRSDSRQRTA